MFVTSAALVAALVTSGAFTASAANCARPNSCTPLASSRTRTAARKRATARERIRFARPTTAHVPSTTLTDPSPGPTTRVLVPTAAPPTNCAEVVAGVVWPPAWRVRCTGPRPGFLGLTSPTAFTTLYVRPSETIRRLRVVALHEAGHAWDFARLRPARIRRWCIARGCDAAHFFSVQPGRSHRHEPPGAEDWAASWDACHGGKYHRSYFGLAAPTRTQCALQNALVGYQR